MCEGQWYLCAQARAQALGAWEHGEPCLVITSDADLAGPKPDLKHGPVRNHRGKALARERRIAQMARVMGQ